MKILKLVSMFSLLSLGWSTSSVGAPGDIVQTSNRMIDMVQIQNSASGAVYYIVAVGGWQATNCSGVVYAYISEDAPGAKAILAAALAAKATGAPLTFTGICGDTGGNTQYLQIRYTVL